MLRNMFWKFYFILFIFQMRIKFDRMYKAKKNKQVFLRPLFFKNR